ADTTRLGGGSPVFYKHGIYKSGYIHKGQIMGHHVGSDATAFSAELRYDHSERLTMNLLANYQERGKSLAIKEKHQQAEIGADWGVTSQLMVNARYGFDMVDNWNFVPGDDTFHFGELGLEYRW
ncbi:MAG: capsule assembly Wzi family protein, partial [Desulfuromonadales bacterium]